MSCDSTTKSTVCVCEGGGGQVREVPGYVCVCEGERGGGQVREVPGYVCVCVGGRGNVKCCHCADSCTVCAEVPSLEPTGGCPPNLPPSPSPPTHALLTCLTMANGTNV